MIKVGEQHIVSKTIQWLSGVPRQPVLNNLFFCLHGILFLALLITFVATLTWLIGFNGNFKFTNLFLFCKIRGRKKLYF